MERLFLPLVIFASLVLAVPLAAAQNETSNTTSNITVTLPTISPVSPPAPVDVVGQAFTEDGKVHLRISCLTPVGVEACPLVNFTVDAYVNGSWRAVASGTLNFTKDASEKGPGVFIIEREVEIDDRVPHRVVYVSYYNTTNETVVVSREVIPLPVGIIPYRLSGLSTLLLLAIAGGFIITTSGAFKAGIVLLTSALLLYIMTALGFFNAYTIIPIIVVLGGLLLIIGRGS